MAVAFPNGEIETCRGTIEGLIGYEQKGKNGFGYDPIVYVPEYEMTTGEMAPELKTALAIEESVRADERNFEEKIGFKLRLGF